MSVLCLLACHYCIPKFTCWECLPVCGRWNQPCYWGRRSCEHWMQGGCVSVWRFDMGSLDCRCMSLTISFCPPLVFIHLDEFSRIYHYGLQVKPDKVCSQIGLCIFNGTKHVRWGSSCIIIVKWLLNFNISGSPLRKATLLTLAISISHIENTSSTNFPVKYLPSYAVTIWTFVQLTLKKPWCMES